MTYNSTEEAMSTVRRFESRSLTKTEWNHAAHLTVGLYYCLRFPFGVALEKMRRGVRAINAVHGVENTKQGGYHETLTVFWMVVIKQFAETSRRYSFGEAANQLFSICGDPRLPFEYYSRELLFSEEARVSHVQPDLEALYLFVSSAEMATRAGGYSVDEFA